MIVKIITKNKLKNSSKKSNRNFKTNFMQTTTGVVTVQNKKYPYTITKRKDNIVYIECVAAKVAQEFLAEDVADLLIDLPNLIVAEREYQERQSDVLRFRVTAQDKQKIEKRAVAEGYASVSEYLRQLALKGA